MEQFHPMHYLHLVYQQDRTGCSSRTHSVIYLDIFC